MFRSLNRWRFVRKYFTMRLRRRRHLCSAGRFPNDALRTYALSLASSLLFEGDSSRLYQKLVKGDESVVSIEASMNGVGHPHCTSSRCPNRAKRSARIASKIFDEIKRIATDGPTAAEMEKLRNSLCNDAVRGRQSYVPRSAPGGVCVVRFGSETRRFRVGPVSQHHCRRHQEGCFSLHGRRKPRRARYRSHACRGTRRGNDRCFATAAGRATSTCCLPRWFLKSLRRNQVAGKRRCP